MAALPRVDVAPIKFMKLQPDFERWLGTLVDNINTALQDIESQLTSLDARITALGG